MSGAPFFDHQWCVNDNQLYSHDASCGISALAHSCCTHNVLLLHPSQGNPQNNLLLCFRNVVLGYGGASSKAMECHYLLCNLRTLHCTRAVPPVVAPNDIPKEKLEEVRRQVHTKCGCLYKCME